MNDKILTGEDILAAPDLQIEIFPVPEWRGSVRLRGPTALEMDEWDESVSHMEYDAEGNPKRVNTYPGMKARLVVKGLVKENGERIYTDADAPKLAKAKGAAGIQRVYSRLLELSGRVAGEAKKLEKNSAPGQSEDSPSH